MELIKVLLVATMVFAFGCTDSSSTANNKTAKGTPAGASASKPEADKKATPTPTPKPSDAGTAKPSPAEKEGGTAGAPDKEEGDDSGDPDVDAPQGVATALKSAAKGGAAKVTLTASVPAADSKLTTSARPGAPAASAGAPVAATGTPAGSPAEKKAEAADAPAAEAAKTASPEQLKAVKTVVATLNAAHLQLLNKTERQFNIAKDAIGNSVLKEISTYLGRHLDRTGVAEKLVQYAGDCANRETKKRSKIGFHGTGDSLELNLYLAPCDRKEGVKAANIRLRPSQNAFELHFFNENLSSTSVAWVQLISNEGQCQFYHKPENYGADALVQMDCGETHGKCGADAIDKLPSFKGIAVAIPSARPGVTELAMFERFFQYNETHGSEHFPKKFYSCAHRFEQKRTECTSDCLDRKVTTVMILKDDKYHVNPDYLNDAKRAFEKTELARKEQERRDSAEAVQKQAAAAAAAASKTAKPKTQAELIAEHQAALLQQQGGGVDAQVAPDELSPEQGKEQPGATPGAGDLTSDGRAQYPKPPVAAPPSPKAAVGKSAVKPRSELSAEELDQLSPEHLELAEQAERVKQEGPRKSEASGDGRVD